MPNSNTRSIQVGSVDNTLIATAYNTDGSIKADLAFDTTGISIFVQRIGEANGSALTLSAKSTPQTAHADGAFLNLGGGDISVDCPDAPFATYKGRARIYGTFDGGTIIGEWFDVVGFDAAAVAVGANTTTPANGDIAAIKAKTDNLPNDPAGVSDVSPTINFNPTIEPTPVTVNPTELSSGSVDAIRDGLATRAKQDEILGAIDGIEGGGSSVNVLPAVGIVADRSPGATITPVVGETISQSITLYATDGTTPISLSGKTLAIVFETLQGVDVAVVASGSITISGSNSNVVTFAYPSVVTASERTLRFAIRDAAAPLTLYLQGLCIVTRAPQVD